MENHFFKRIDTSTAKKHFVETDYGILCFSIRSIWLYYCTIALNTNYKNHYKEVCILENDWLIRDERVAPKVYAMKTLAHLGQKNPWIKRQLRDFIN